MKQPAEWLVRRESESHSLQRSNAKGEQYTKNPYVWYDEGTEVERPPPILQVGTLLNTQNYHRSTGTDMESIIYSL